MRRILLGAKNQGGLSILIFAEGTVLKPKHKRWPYNFRAYVPAGDCAEKIRGWEAQGADILYCTSRRGKQAGVIAGLLECYGFPGVCLAVRDRGEGYKELVEALAPDILIEDDCRSIGGARQWCITQASPAMRERIHSVIVPEYGGLRRLPAELERLRIFTG